MAYDPGAIDATLAAAVGEDQQLIAELRHAFAESANRALAAMTAAQSEDEWQSAAQRLKGLAASFGAVRLMAAADDAAEASVGDPRLLQRLRRALPRA